MALSFSGISNIGEFYSHHYLDELIERDLRRLLQRWREKPGLHALVALRKRYEGLRRELERLRGGPTTDLRATLTRQWHRELLAELGYTTVTPDGTLVELEPNVLAHAVLELPAGDGRRLLVVEAPFLDTGGVLLEAIPLSPLGVKHLEGETTFYGSLEDLITALFSMERPPRWVLAMGGRELMLVERSRWGHGRYLSFDLDALTADKEALEVAASLLCREAVCPEDGAAVHDVLDEESHKHAYGVSEDLKYNVREAVEMLANAWVKHQRESKKKLYADDPGSLFDDQLARELTNECLTFLYRLLFIFYAEARGEELGVLPMKSEAYRAGYSLEHLRDLELVPLHGHDARNGTFLHDSVERLFELIHRGVQYPQREFEVAEPFEIPALDSALFDPARTPRLSAARFPNEVMQKVLRLLSLSREGQKVRGRRKDRGRISYSRLGINQLGAVYEGLLSYTGFFAREDLYELKKAEKKGDEDLLEQVFFARASELSKFEDDEFVLQPNEANPDAPPTRKKYTRGTFVYRLAGRDRQRSASYYTPEVLTQCVVKYSLKELLKDRKADEILALKLCEPAMGSGAFLNEAINQLADAYLERKQAETGMRVPQVRYGAERQRVKAFLATHNAYGVDLNPVASDLAKVSLWLNILGPGIPVPWFDLRLGVGNSLFGCRRQVFLRGTHSKRGATFHDQRPQSVPLGAALPPRAIFHFLLPDEGMAAIAKHKIATDLAPESGERMKRWITDFVAAAWTETDLERLATLTVAGDRLWQAQVTLRQRVTAQTAQDIPIWPAKLDGSQRDGMSLAGRERLLGEVGAPGSPGRRLGLAMDAWCALWVWPVQYAHELPSRAEWLLTMEDLFSPESSSVDRVRANHKWLQRVGDRFFHWELTFAEVFAERGGFDLVLGNPPWVKLEWKESGILSEFDATVGLRDISASNLAKRRRELLASERQRTDYLAEMAHTLGTQEFLGAENNYQMLSGVLANLYKNFLVSSWRLMRQDGAVGMIHQPALFDDPAGAALRKAAYPRLRFMASFINELKLFSEIGNVRPYCITVWGSRSAQLAFKFIGNLFHPRTIDESFLHIGAGMPPGIKTDDGDWEVRGHKSRLVDIDLQALKLFARLYDAGGTSPAEARLPIVHSTEMLRVLERFLNAPKLSDAGAEWYHSEMWNETVRQADGTILAEERDCKAAEEWIVSGPHIHVACPFNKTPNPNCRSHRDYVQIDLTHVADDYLPRTLYIPGYLARATNRTCSKAQYRERTKDVDGVAITEFYRHVHRRRLDVIGERTLIPSIIPPGAGHIDALNSLCFKDSALLLRVSAFASSIVADFFVRSAGKRDLRGADFGQLPIPRLHPAAIIRALRLNCLTRHYAPLWREVWLPEFAKESSWTKRDHRLSQASLSGQWHHSFALRNDFERRQALVEIDVLAAIALGISIDELCLIYRVQFPVLISYEREKCYDQTGRIVSLAAVNEAFKSGMSEGSVPDVRVPSTVYHLPFTLHDRELDMRQAYAEFERRFALGAIGVA
jgi:hypothetical protein